MIIIIIMMWHPIGSQVACKVVFRPMPSGGVCKVSWDPLKAPSEGPIECKSFRVTRKHAYCVWLGKCMVVAPPSHLPHLVPTPVQYRHSCLCPLTVLHMPSPSASCLSSKWVLRVHSLTFGVLKVCSSSLLGILGFCFWGFESVIGCSWPFRVSGYVPGSLGFFWFVPHLLGIYDLAARPLKLVGFDF